MNGSVLVYCFESYICLMYYFSLATVLYIQLSTDRISVREHQSVTLTCTVKDATGLVDEITFVRRTDQKNYVCSTIFQGFDKCEIIPQRSHCPSSCGPGTSNASLSIKRYTLWLPQMDLVDFTDWWCQTKFRKHHRNTLTLVQNSK